MTSPRPLSGVFVASSIPEPRSPGGRKSLARPKAPTACYPSGSRGREEIIHTTCSPAGASFSRRRSPVRGTSPEPQPPQFQRKSSSGLAKGAQSPKGAATPSSPSRPIEQLSRIPRPRMSTKRDPEATKTISAINDALRAVRTLQHTALMKSKSAAGDCSPSPSPSEDLESLCGTECTESTACSSSFSFSSFFSEDGLAGERRASASLRDARRSLKERIGAEERSLRFTRGLLAKLDEFRDVVAEDGSEVA